MLYTSAEDFINTPHKVVTVMGMSGVGKTTLAARLTFAGWQHYSTDYQIGIKYLAPHLQNPETVRPDNLGEIAKFLALPGNTQKGGVDLDEFWRRQNLYKNGEINAGFDFEEALNETKGNILNDTAGSLCELERPDLIKFYAKHSLLLYIKATEDDEKELFQRSIKTPKPFLFHEDFFKTHLDLYMKENTIENVGDIDPGEFYYWVFPKLFNARIPKYEKIAEDYGYTITTEELKTITNEQDFVELISTAIDRK